MARHVGAVAAGRGSAAKRFSDREQNWCLSLALWNGVDPILKERMFGLSGEQGNHGEDAKEYWWFTDATPTHSWNSWRYHYPQARFPYDDLIVCPGAKLLWPVPGAITFWGIADEGDVARVMADIRSGGVRRVVREGQSCDT